MPVDHYWDFNTFRAGGEINHDGLRSPLEYPGFGEIELDLRLQARRIGESGLEGLDGGRECALAPLGLAQRHIQLLIGAVQLQGRAEQTCGLRKVPLVQPSLPPGLIRPHESAGDRCRMRWQQREGRFILGDGVAVGAACDKAVGEA